MRNLIHEHPASALLFAGMLMFIFLGNQVSVPVSLQTAVHKISKTYAASQTDTVHFPRERGLSGLSFAMNILDSSNITNVVLRRSIDGTLSPAVAGDTLISSDSSATARSIVKTVTLAPLCDDYVFIVKWKANTGAIDQGTTTPTVKYQTNAQYSFSSQ